MALESRNGPDARPTHWNEFDLQPGLSRLFCVVLSVRGVQVRTCVGRNRKNVETGVKARGWAVVNGPESG